MARITSLTPDPIVVDVANATVDVHAVVSYSRSDKDANTPYRMICTLLGHDPAAEFGEDAVDDVIPNGTLTRSAVRSSEPTASTCRPSTSTRRWPFRPSTRTS
jgi:hypothetical protein